MWKSVQKRDRIIWKSGNPYEAGTDKTFSLDTLPQEYTAYGNGDYRINGLETEQADGSDTANLKYESYEISKGKYSLKGLPAMFAKEDEAETLEIVLKDYASGLRAHLLYGVFPQLDVITRAVRLENTGAAPVTVKKAMSMEMDYEYRELDAVHFYGKHNMERQMERTHLGHGNWSVGSIRGTSSHHHNPFVILCDRNTEEAKNIGLDMFVLDDGWFGKRDNDFCALGDWVVNEEKIKGGLPALAERIHGLGLKFGLWVEPEMINEDSDLYREHPDWALKIPGRAMNRSRHQLNLDITRKEVRDHVMNQIFSVLDACKVDYVKWDMNRSVDNVFSAALPRECQGEVYHRYVLAVYEMMESLVQRYPDLLFEGCSGGGGRFEAGMLYYSPQIWCSDNTDAIDRLKIQYGTSFGYPISAMGSHVSVCPNHQSGRITPFETRGIVASAGTFGYELDLMKMSEEEKKIAREQILKYKEMEHLVQTGDYYRLVNPFENNNHVLWQFVSKDKKETVVCGVRLHSEANPHIYLFYPQGLDADMKYEDIATGKVYTGAALMKAGLPLPLTTGDYQPIKFTFRAVEK